MLKRTPPPNPPPYMGGGYVRGWVSPCTNPCLRCCDVAGRTGKRGSEKNPEKIFEFPWRGLGCFFVRAVSKKNPEKISWKKSDVVECVGVVVKDGVFMGYRGTAHRCVFAVRIGGWLMVRPCCPLGKNKADRFFRILV